MRDVDLDALQREFTLGYRSEPLPRQLQFAQLGLITGTHHTLNCAAAIGFAFCKANGVGRSLGVGLNKLPVVYCTAPLAGQDIGSDRDGPLLPSEPQIRPRRRRADDVIIVLPGYLDNKYSDPDVPSTQSTKWSADMPKLTVNGASMEVSAAADTPLLWVIREHLGLTGTKFGCGIAQCGACTVHIDGVATRSCSIPLSAVAPDQKIVTIEGLSPDGSHPVQKAWLAMDVPQCGYCQTGMIMSAAALLAEKHKPSDAEIDAAMTNICRCGTYLRVRAAIHAVADGVSKASKG